MSELESLIRLVYEPEEAEALLRLLAATPLTKPEEAELTATLIAQAEKS